MADEKKVTDAEVATKKAKKAEKKAKKAPSKFSPKNVGKGIARFFKDLRGETKKIVWPGAKMIVKSTGVVLATILVLGAVVWLIDFATSGAITALNNAANEVTEVQTTEASDETDEQDHDHSEDETEEDATAND
ncbi:MAG: preprotein translocase subunit SecE [Clostridia bacterium]|nr:preprotein translocase subunit SecE [Clostridia bacterium]